MVDRVQGADDCRDVEASVGRLDAWPFGTLADPHHLDAGEHPHAPRGEPLDQHSDEHVGRLRDAGGVADLPAPEGAFYAQPDGVPTGKAPRILAEPGGHVEDEFCELCHGQAGGESRDALPRTQPCAHLGRELLLSGELGLEPQSPQRLPGAVEPVEQVAPGDRCRLAEGVAERGPLLAPVGGQDEAGAVGEAVAAGRGGHECEPGAVEFRVQGPAGLAEQVAPGRGQGDDGLVRLAGDVDACAEFRLTLEHDDFVPDLGEAGGSRQSGKPAADDSDQRAATQARKAVAPRRIWVSSITARATVPISRMPARIAACTG